MAQTIVLIDYENVGAPGLENLPTQCRVILFIGRSQPLPKNDLIEKLLNDGKRVEIVKIAGVGKDNLDHHLALYLGKTIALEPQANFIIISSDKSGFDPLAEHVTKVLGTSCKRQTPHKRQPKQPAAAPKSAAPKITAAKQVQKAPPAAKTTPAKPPVSKTAKPKTATVAQARAFLDSEKHPPRTREKLLRHLERHFAIVAAQTDTLFTALEKGGFIKVDEKGKVSYLTKNMPPVK